MCVCVSYVFYSLYTQFFTLKVHSFVNNFLAAGKIDTSLKIFAYKYEYRRWFWVGVETEQNSIYSPSSDLVAMLRIFCQAAKRQTFAVKVIYETAAYVDNACNKRMVAGSEGKLCF